LEQYLGRKLNLFLAIGANHAHQALREDAVQGRNEVIRLDPHVDETANHVGDVVGVDSCEYQVARERRLNGDLRRLLIANFADHDFVRVVTQNRPQAASKRQSLLFVHRNLGDAADLIFDGIFDGDNLVFVGLDFIDCGVQRGRLARARGARDQDHSVRLANVAPEFAHIMFGEAHYVEVQSPKFLTQRFFIQHAQHSVFAVYRRHDRNTEVDEPAFITHAETAILRNAPLGDIEFAHDFDARENRGMPFLRQRLHGVLQHAVNAVFHRDFGVARFNMDVTGAPLERRKNDSVNQADDGAHTGVAGELVHRNVFVALFVADNLERESFCRLIENALGLLRAFQQVADLRGGGNADDQLLAQQQRQFVIHQQLAGIRNHNNERIVVGFERNEVVAEHQFRGNGME